MLRRPEDYRWSSYAQRAGQSEQFTWLDTDPCFEGLGDRPQVRASGYAEFVRSAIPPGEWEMIRSFSTRSDSWTLPDSYRQMVVFAHQVVRLHRSAETLTYWPGEGLVRLPMGIHVLPQSRVDPRLILAPLGSEPGQQVGINP